MRRRVVPGAARQTGRSLLELIVAMGIGLSMSMAIVAIYLNAQSGSRVQQGAASVSDAGRHAMQLVGRYLRQAGYHRQAFYDSTWVLLPDDGYISVFGCMGGFVDPAAAVLACNDTVALPDAFAVRHGVDVAENAGGPALRGVGYDAGRGRGTDCLGNPVPLPADPASGAFQVEDRFFVAAHPQTGLRELYCLGGASAAAQPVAEGIEDLVLRYSVDRTSLDPGAVRDMSPDAFTRANGVLPTEWVWNDMTGATSTPKARRVLGVEVCMVVRSPERSVTGGQAYTDCRDVQRTGDDGFYRQVLRSMVVLRNHL
jgi:type IV pilus assembly protein PilW